MGNVSVVSVESGKYVGCRLTCVGRDSLGWYVCLNSYEVGGYVRVRRVTFVRETSTTFDPSKDDRVMFDDFIRRIEFARRMTGANGEAKIAA